MIDEQLKKLHWASRRGMLELDVVLIPYLEQEACHFDDAKSAEYAIFLEQDDPDLYSWIMGYETPKPEFAAFVADIKEFINKQIK
ncbi:MAG TPA: succinate dehydrogenase assembly factor 2 [Kangiella sp.]|uniref:FAD assembly factor SdhE n=1 Tax=Kangiella sp. TaxID=1920245 RepID=UPI002F943661